MKTLFTTALALSGILVLAAIGDAAPPFKIKLGTSAPRPQFRKFTMKKSTIAPLFKKINNGPGLNKWKPGPNFNLKKIGGGPVIKKAPAFKKLGGINALKGLKKLGFGVGKMKLLGKKGFVLPGKQWCLPSKCVPSPVFGCVYYVKYQLPMQQVSCFQSYYYAQSYANQLRSFGFVVVVYQNSPFEYCVQYSMPYWQYVQCHNWHQASSLAAYLQSMGGWVYITY